MKTSRQTAAKFPWPLVWAWMGVTAVFAYGSWPWGAGVSAGVLWPVGLIGVWSLALVGAQGVGSYLGRRGFAGSRAAFAGQGSGGGWWSGFWFLWGVWLATWVLLAGLAAGMVWVLVGSWSGLRGEDFGPPGAGWAVLLAVAGMGLFFVRSLVSGGMGGKAAEVGEDLAGPPRSADLRPTSDLLLGLLGVQLVVLWVGVAPFGWPVYRVVLGAVTVVAVLLPAEWLVAAGWRFFQARSQRSAELWPGFSASLWVLLAGRRSVHRLALALQESLGIEVKGGWVADFGRKFVEPCAWALLGVGWLSTALVVVPLGSVGVWSRWGRFAEVPLAPGLQVVAPWPMSRVVMVPVGRVEALALGFDQDLGGAILWTEVHFSGERNLLVGNGEEVLAFNVPIHFVRRDAVSGVRSTVDLVGLVRALARRELLLATARRGGFAIMTAERLEVSEQIREGLQAAADRLGLGIEVVFVGLKDVHPPVEVAPAFQEVISSQEQKRMMIELARANRIRALAEAEVDAFRLRSQAESQSVERVASTTGEAARLSGQVAARGVSPEWFELESRLRLATEIFPQVRLFVVPDAIAAEQTRLLDYRDGAATGR